MMKRIETDFLFALTNPGTEKALKLEVETMGLGWRLSYQRRGFVTFKADAPFSLETLDAEIACARRLRRTVHGVVHGEPHPLTQGFKHGHIDV